MIFWNTLLLLLANLGPLYGVWALDWSVTLLLFYYWSESAIIGFFTLLKMAKAKHLNEGETLDSSNGDVRIARMIFFFFQFVVFMFGHLLFLIILFAPLDTQLPALLENPTVGLNQVKYFYLLTFLCHALSFGLNYIRKKEYLKAEVDDLMQSAFKRVAFLHMIIIGSGWLIALFQVQDIFVLMFFAVLFKTFADLYGHLKAHGLLQKQ